MILLDNGLKFKYLLIYSNTQNIRICIHIQRELKKGADFTAVLQPLI